MYDKISVRAVAGRIARTSPRGPFIPHDVYVDVEVTPYVLRLLNFHADIEVQPAAPEAVAEPAPQTKTKGA